MRKPTDAQLRSARVDFKELLSKSTPESEWQSFFGSHPFVLSRALPLRLKPCDLLPLGRPGRSEPDFVIYPGSTTSATTHGLIELKTASSRVVTIARRNVLSLTRDAACAVRQLQIYDRDYDLFSPVKRCISFAGRSHLFVVMGLEAEISALSDQRDLATQMTELLPPQVRLLTFDELLRQYDKGLPLRSFVLLPLANRIQERPVTANGSPWAGLPKRMRRSALHDRFGGNRLGGISVIGQSATVLLFYCPGSDYGYSAAWSIDGCFHYPGEGMRGNQEMGFGNRAVLEAAQQRRSIRLFQYLEGGEVEYEGEFELDAKKPWYMSRALDADGAEREIIQFRLRPIGVERAAA